MEDHKYCLEITETTQSQNVSSSVQGPTNLKYCNMCDKSFQSRSGLSKHRLKVHSAVTEGSIKCMETGCSILFKTTNGLKTHLTTEHDFKFTTEIKLFPNMKEFLQWKDDIEEKNDVRYVAQNGISRYSDKKVQHLKCHRSGKYVPRVAAGERQRRLKNQGSAKLGQLCTSELTVTEYTEDSQVKVNYCATHYGHNMGCEQLGHLFLSKTQKDSIAEQLLQGVTVNKILENIRDNESGMKAIKLKKTAHKSIWRIKQSYGIQCVDNDNDNDAENVEETFELVEKPQEKLDTKIKSLKALYLSSFRKIALCKDINILDAVTAQMIKINNMLSMGSSSQGQCSLEPANKLIPKQVRITSTKRRRKQNQMSKKKPNAIEMNTILDDLLNT